MLTLSLKNKETIKQERSREGETYLVFKNYPYQLGDYFELTLSEPNQLVWVQMDAAIEPSLIYVEGTKWRYQVILDEKLGLAYSPNVFKGTRHFVKAWLPTIDEINAYRNLAKNPHDQKDDSKGYPHAYANVETRNDSTFFARNAIDGIVANENHGSYPYQSWGINQRADAQITIDFVREVLIDKVALVLRGDYPHDSYWTRVTLELSTGDEYVLDTTNALDRQFFDIPSTVVTSVTLKNLIKHEDDSPFPALTQIEVFGKEYSQEFDL